MDENMNPSGKPRKRLRPTAASGLARLSSPARYVIAVGSGKGGVGKSTISLNLAMALSRLGYEVGLLDADPYGPNIPRMLNMARHVKQRSWTLFRNPELQPLKLEPIESHGVKIMSTGFIVAEDQSLTWNAGLIAFLMKQLVADVIWGELDYLVVDLPPGTGDVIQTISALVEVQGAIIVVTPSDVSHLDARRTLEMYRQSAIPVLGAVENLASARCPDCQHVFPLSLSVRDDRSVWKQGVSRLVSLPYDSRIAHADEAGIPIVIKEPDSETSRAFLDLARTVSAQVGGFNDPSQGSL